MAPPNATQLSILLTDSTVVVLTIPTAIAQVPGQWNVDITIASIFKRGYFWGDNQATAYPVSQIKSITYS